jgi:hypothetical protein
MHLLCSVQSDPDSLPALAPINFFQLQYPRFVCCNSSSAPRTRIHDPNVRLGFTLTSISLLLEAFDKIFWMSTKITGFLMVKSSYHLDYSSPMYYLPNTVFTNKESSSHAMQKCKMTIHLTLHTCKQALLRSIQMNS